VIGKLRASIPGQRFPEGARKFTNRFNEGIHNNVCSFLSEFDEDNEPRSSFDQRRNEGPARAFHQITLPMPWHRSIFHLRRPLAYRDCIDDPFALPAIGCVARAADAPLRTEVADQLLLQGAASLDEKAAVDRLV